MAQTQQEADKLKKEIEKVEKEVAQLSGKEQNQSQQEKSAFEDTQMEETKDERGISAHNTAVDSIKRSMVQKLKEAEAQKRHSRSSRAESPAFNFDTDGRTPKHRRDIKLSGLPSADTW